MFSAIREFCCNTATPNWTLICFDIPTLLSLDFFCIELISRHKLGTRTAFFFLAVLYERGKLRLFEKDAIMSSGPNYVINA
jgi:hypothetical protein